MFYSVRRRAIDRTSITRDIFYGGVRARSTQNIIIIINLSLGGQLFPPSKSSRDRSKASFFFRGVLGFGDKKRRTFSSLWSSRRTFRGPRRFFRVSSGSSPFLVVKSAADDDDDDDLKVVTLLRLGLSPEEDVNAARLGGWRRRGRGKVFLLATIARLVALFVPVHAFFFSRDFVGVGVKTR